MLLRTRRDTQRLGSRIGERLRSGDLVLLVGALGSGKTFLTRAIARGLGVPAGVRITSPTFTLVQEYDTRLGGSTLLHADLYRLLETKDPRREIERLGIRERRAEGCIVVCEWGRDAAGWLGGDAALVVELAIRGRGREAKLSGRLSKDIA
jgi:tRNA threonylcarbamoyladenosine biosynthesis protein TsaE